MNVETTNEARRQARVAADAIKTQIQELAAFEYDVEIRLLRFDEWHKIRVENVRAEGVMLRIETEGGVILCAPLQFGAEFRRVPKLAAVP
jgi:hypothetical protein